LAGTQRIGWEPLSGKIKSWFFDADGGYSEGVWTRDGDQWTVASAGVHPDGKRASATNIYQRAGNDKFTLESTGAKVDGQTLPDFKLQIVRKEAIE
jgi:hypothetical protein